jgi:hypothetical protein
MYQVNLRFVAYREANWSKFAFWFVYGMVQYTV